MEKKNIFSEITERIQAETPIFFKKVINLSVGLMGVGLAIKGIDQTGLAVKLPAIVDMLSNYAITAGVVAGAIAKMTKTTPNNETNKQ